MNTRITKLVQLLPAVLVAGLYMSCGPVTEEENPYGYRGGDDQATSSIVPMAPVIPYTDTIRLQSPSFARTLPMGQRVSLEFGTTGYKHGILIVMKERPDVASGKVENLADACVAGAASMAGQVFDGSLAVGPDASDLYACTGDASTPLSRTVKVKICRDGSATCMRDGVAYWWFVLGYDDQMRLTHSSPAFRFRLEQ